MKKLSLFLVAVLMSGLMYGQFKIGPQIGYTASKLSYKGSDISNGLKHNMIIGAFMRIGKKIYVQPEVNYMTQGSVFKFNIKNFSPVKQDITLKSIQVPLNIGWRILNLKVFNLRIFGGATANFIVNKQIATTKDPSDPNDYLVPSNFENTQWQYQFGVGVDIFMFALDVKYYGGINDIFNGTINYDNTTHQVNGAANAFEVTLGWKIL
jgi:hypothetical protein